MNGQHTIYALIDPWNNEVRYIGVTRNTLAYRLGGHMYQAVGNRVEDPKGEWIRELREASLRPIIQPIETVDSALWQSAEKRWIAHYKALGARLTNKTIGGAGAPGYVMSDENRAALSALWLGSRREKPFTPERLANMSEGSRRAWQRPDRKPRAPITEAARENMAAAQRGKKATAEARANMRAAHANVTEEHRQKLREATLSRPEAQRKAFGQIAVGCRRSDETKKKMSDARKAYWARKRAENSKE